MAPERIAGPGNKHLGEALSSAYRSTGSMDADENVVDKDETLKAAGSKLATALIDGGTHRQARSKGSGQLQDTIASIIQDLPRGVHLTAPEVYRRAQELGLRVSLSTVYRHLNLMQAHGNVSTVAGDHGKRYEARDLDHDHDHLICLKCGLTIEFTDDLIRGFGKAVAERKGYEHQSSRFDILGVCGDCHAKDEDHKIAISITALYDAISLIEDCLPKLQTSLVMLESRKSVRAVENLTSALPLLRQACSQAETSATWLAQGSTITEDNDGT